MNVDPCELYGCADGEHHFACPIGRGMERFAIVDALGNVRGHEWLSPQMAAQVREDIERRKEEDRMIVAELFAEEARATVREAERITKEASP